MKRLILLFYTILCTISIAAQNRPAIELAGEWVDNKYVQHASNNDYCPYYIAVDLTKVIGFNNVHGSSYTTTILGRSKKTLYTLVPSGTISSNASITYHNYRGDINNKLNIDFQYALPIKQGSTAEVHIQDNSDYAIVFDMSSTVDTIYACRGGIVCDDDLSDTSSKGYRKTDKILTVYHNDGTMAEYKMFSQALVYPGESINMGDPIAVCKSDNAKMISIGIYFLDKNKVQVEKDGRKHSHFKPFYHTLNSGIVRLEAGNSYTSEITEEMIMQDMSSGEKKRYLKSIQK